MKVAVIGWYGTETLGDRAILAGLVSMLNHMDRKFELLIGSLYSFFTERTIDEDGEIYTQFENLETIRTLSIQNRHERNELIETADFIIFGGGPIMDNIRFLDLLLFIVKAAKKKGTMFIISGCGIGPLNIKYFQNKAKKICALADLIILRDEASKKTLLSYGMYKQKIYVLPDPAILAALDYLEYRKNAKNKELSRQRKLVINLREYGNEFKNGIDYNDLNFADSIRSIIESGKYDESIFVPMHSFGIGGDDRIYLHKIKNLIGNNTIKVIDDCLTLYELFDTFSEAIACVGMRYHSVVFQTILNGNNVILDYTDGKKGKIQSFIREINGEDFYAERLCPLQNAKEKDTKYMDNCLKILENKEHFYYERDILLNQFNQYICLLRQVISLSK